MFWLFFFDNLLIVEFNPSIGWLDEYLDCVNDTTFFFFQESPEDCRYGKLHPFLF
jgi:hypothetical protein